MNAAQKKNLALITDSVPKVYNNFDYGTPKDANGKVENTVEEGFYPPLEQASSRYNIDANNIGEN